MPTFDHRAATTASQSAAFSPRQQHAVRLLQMSSLDFAALVRSVGERNVFLDVETDASGEADVGAGGHASHADRAGAPTREPSGALPTPAVGADPFDVGGHGAAEAGQTAIDSPDRHHDGESLRDAAVGGHDDEPAHERDDGDGDGDGDDRGLWHDGRAGSGSGSGAMRDDDGPGSALDRLAMPSPLNAHLHGQLAGGGLDARQRLLAAAVIESLDDDGYLRGGWDGLAAALGLAPSPDAAELDAALAHVQAMDPPGVGARSLRECLRLQLDAIACPTQRALARLAIDEHLELLAHGDVAALAQRLHIAPPQAEALRRGIRRLDPRPGLRFGGTHAAFVIPDVIVRKARGRWQAELNAAIVPRVRIDEVYARLYRTLPRSGVDVLGADWQQARWTVRNVRQRFTTILEVARSIVHRQQAFFEHGEMAMRPLALRDVAADVGVHESTVSRVTNNKFAAVPGGVVELKRFFSRSTATLAGHDCAWTAVRGLVRGIVAAEPPHAPLSDTQIAQRLRRQGLVVARRTVTKYRQVLDIASASQRRRDAA